MNTTRRLLQLAALAVAALAIANPAPDLTALAEYNFHYGKFSRDHWGCPEHAAQIEQCAAGAGFLNAKEFVKSRELAKRLYGLRD